MRHEFPEAERSVTQHEARLVGLGAGLLLLVLVQCQKSDTSDLDHLETDTGDVSHGVSAASEPGDKHFVLSGETKNNAHIHRKHFNKGRFR